jgi:hypothetical protein
MSAEHLARTRVVTWFGRNMLGGDCRRDQAETPVIALCRFGSISVEHNRLMKSD